MGVLKRVGFIIDPVVNVRQKMLIGLSVALDKKSPQHFKYKRYGQGGLTWRYAIDYLKALSMPRVIISKFTCSSLHGYALINEISR